MNQTTSRKGAFTLVEMLVAIAVLSILLAVVFVPLRLAISTYHIGSARNSTQNAAQASLDDMERDFRRAGYVFPNTALVGVTDKAPYTNNRPPNAGIYDPGFPYVKSLDDTVDRSDRANTPPYLVKRGICEKPGQAMAWGNTSRVDMIPVRRNVSGQVVLPVQLGDTIVTYYPRRLNMGLPYDPIDNPVVLFRAEIPYRDANGTLKTTGPSPDVNADVSLNRLGIGGACATGTTTRGSQWLTHNAEGEANLEPLTDLSNLNTGVNGAPLPSASHTVAIPRGVGLVESQAFRTNYSSQVAPTPTPAPTAESPLVPDTSFQLSDTNGDGKIDQVAASLALETFDANQGAAVGVNNQPTGQIVRARRTFDLPNVR